MKVNKITTKLIKPLTPTPKNLENFYLSFIDKYMGPMNFAVILFYQSKPRNNTHLQESLAKTLVHFYPLAGRYIKNDHMVCCRDQGVEFIEAKALDVDMLDLVSKPETEQLNALLPGQHFRGDEALNLPIMSIQATHFPSNSLANAISVSHRLFDMASMATFIDAWSKETPGFSPTFDLPSLIPCKNENPGMNSDQIIFDDDTIVVKRFVFNKAAIRSLRSGLRPYKNGKMVSRVCVVSCVIAKALIDLDGVKLGVSRDFVINQAINMRERTILPQPKHACRNLSIPSMSRRVEGSEAEKIGLQELVDLIGECVEKSIADYAEILLIGWTWNHDKHY